MNNVNQRFGEMNLGRTHAHHMPEQYMNLAEEGKYAQQSQQFLGQTYHTPTKSLKPQAQGGFIPERMEEQAVMSQEIEMRRQQH